MTLLRGSQILLGLVTTYFMVRFLSKEEYGEYQYILSFVGALSFLSLTNLKSSTMQAIVRGHYGVYPKAARLSFLGSCIGSILLAGIGVWYFGRNDSVLSPGFWVAAAFFPFAYGLVQWKSLKMGEEAYPSLVKVEGLNSLTMNAAMIGTLFLFPETYIGPLLFVLLLPGVRNVIATWQDLKKIPKDASVEEGNISYGVKTSLYLGISIVAKHIDKIFLFTFVSPAALATFAVADRIAELLRNMVQDIAVVLGPRFARKKEYDEELDRILKITCLVAGAIIVVFAFTLLPWLMTLVFGAQYIDSVPYAQALLCSVAIGNMAVLRFRFIRSQIDLEGFRIVTIATSVIRIASALVLIPLWGITGAVIAAFVYRIATSLSVDYALKKNYTARIQK